VIQLVTRNIDHPVGYLVYELQVAKARYQDAALGTHQFKIRDSGLKIFPSIHFQVHHYNYMELELKRSSVKELQAEDKTPHKDLALPPESSLIDMISGPREGESIVLLGSRNSFKTQLCLDFLARGNWGCKHAANGRSRTCCVGNPSLLISLIDNAPAIERGLECPWRLSRYDAKKCEFCPNAFLKHARAFCQRPGCITSAEFFHYVRERLDLLLENLPENNRGRVVFWDLTQMDYRFPLFRADKMLLPALMDMLKTVKVYSLFMGAGNADNTPSASAMADHVLFCWRSTEAKPKTSKKDVPKSSLMLYVDRAAAGSGRSGKALYCIPVYKGDRLSIPRDQQQLENDCYIEIAGLPATDAEEISRITRMQGVQ